MRLQRELNLVDVFCIASGAMISSGLFVLPGIAYAHAGPAVLLSYLLAGFLAVTGMLSQAELVSAMPKAGGTYFYVTRSMGPAIGTVDGFITWFSLSLKSAFALVGMAAFAALLVNWNMTLIAIILCALFVLLNLVGVKEAGRVQVALVIGLLAILAFYIVRGTPAVQIMRLEPFAPYGLGAVFSTAGLVFVSFGGLLKVASIAEEVKDPGRVVPLGMILSLVIVTTVYLLVVFVTVGVLDGGVLRASLTPISDGAGAFIGRRGKIILSIAAILAFVSTANAGIMAASRYLFASSRDGLIPAMFGRVSPRFRTPYTAVFTTGLFMAAALFMNIESLVKAASSVLIMTYIFSCLSVIVLRESRLQNYQPRFRAPLYPSVQIAGIVGFGFLLFEMGAKVLITNAVLVVAGLFIYWFYGRIVANREYALLHLIERITAKELTTYSLESELKEIIRERDDIVKDRFDHLIEEAVVLDMDKHMPVGEFFEIAAESLSGRLKLEPAQLVRRLEERERESTTVLSSFLAIPHIVVEGRHTFDILLARCQGGIAFSEEHSSVQAVFVLAGSQDERNFHLRALAAIAQIVQDPDFERKWLHAKSTRELRDVVLLGERRR
jgi:APA family basic amino acid/polyamine antiporter